MRGLRSTWVERGGKVTPAADSVPACCTFRATPDDGWLSSSLKAVEDPNPARVKASKRAIHLLMNFLSIDSGFYFLNGSFLSLLYRSKCLPDLRRSLALDQGPREISVVTTGVDPGKNIDHYRLTGTNGAMATLMGKLSAEAIAGTAERFDLFASLPQPRFPGGTLLRWPGMVAGMFYYAMRDRL